MPTRKWPTNLWDLISNNLAEVQQQLVYMAYASVRQRVAKVLLDLHKKGVLSDKDRNICIARDDIAGLIGTATEKAIRMLTEFKDEGLITIGSGKKIIIKDQKSLLHARFSCTSKVRTYNFIFSKNCLIIYCYIKTAI